MAQSTDFLRLHADWQGVGRTRGSRRSSMFSRRGRPREPRMPVPVPNRDKDLRPQSSAKAKRLAHGVDARVVAPLPPPPIWALVPAWRRFLF